MEMEIQKNHGAVGCCNHSKDSVYAVRNLSEGKFRGIMRKVASNIVPVQATPIPTKNFILKEQLGKSHNIKRAKVDLWSVFV